MTIMRAESYSQVVVRRTLTLIHLVLIQRQDEELKRETIATATTRVKTRTTVTTRPKHQGCQPILLIQVLHNWNEPFTFPWR